MKTLVPRTSKQVKLANECSSFLVFKYTRYVHKYPTCVSLLAKSSTKLVFAVVDILLHNVQAYIIR